MSMILKGIDLDTDYGLCILTKSGELITASGKHIQAIPTIEERKEGRWMNVSFSIGKCSECGFSGGNCYVMKYCPNCGAKMKGE